MVTINQLLKKSRKKIETSVKTPVLRNNPQKKGACFKLFTQKPKKPNSANRSVVKLEIDYKPEVYVNAFIPGEKNELQKHSTVLMRGGRCQDLPGFKYKLIRGKFDLKGVQGRISSRSLYGTRKPK